MKSIEQVKREAICLLCKGKDLTFGAEIAHCNNCDKNFDLGMKKWK